MMIFIRMIILGVVALILGVSVNALAPKSLPLIADAEQFVVKHEEGVDAKVSEIVELWDTGNAIFVDSRGVDLFHKGHIPGSISVPYTAIEEGEIPSTVELLPDDQLLVIYCDGADCHSSQVVFDKLEELGFAKDKMKIFAGGWNEWLRNNGEIEKGGEEDNG